METLLRQKVCKSKHKILITKYLQLEKSPFTVIYFEAKGLGFKGFHFPAVRY